MKALENISYRFTDANLYHGVNNLQVILREVQENIFMLQRKASKNDATNNSKINLQRGTTRGTQNVKDMVLLFSNLEKVTP